MSKKSNVGKNQVKFQEIGNYRIERVIGEGTFGKVHLGIHLQTGEKVAIKILEKSKIKDQESLERVNREIKFLKNLKNENFIHLLEIIENGHSLFLVMEYAQGGELFNYIVKKQRLTEKEASYFFCQIINGITILNEYKIAHRDLKPENLLLNENKVLKIIDFGLSNSYNSDDYLKTPCGSPCYAAPEMLQGKKYQGKFVDVWSTGIILYAMVNGFLPFEDDNNTNLYKKIMECKLFFPYKLNSICLDMIHRLLTVNPDSRITLEEIKNHEFYKIGMKIFKKKELEVDKRKLASMAIEKMIKMNFDRCEIFNNLNNNIHNNITATYNLLYNRLRSEFYQNFDPNINKTHSPSKSIDKEIYSYITVKSNNKLVFEIPMNNLLAAITEEKEILSTERAARNKTNNENGINQLKKKDDEESINNGQKSNGKTSFTSDNLNKLQESYSGDKSNQLKIKTKVRFNTIQEKTLVLEKDNHNENTFKEAEKNYQKKFKILGVEPLTILTKSEKERFFSPKMESNFKEISHTAYKSNFDDLGSTKNQSNKIQKYEISSQILNPKNEKNKVVKPKEKIDEFIKKSGHMYNNSLNLDSININPNRNSIKINGRNNSSAMQNNLNMIKKGSKALNKLILSNENYNILKEIKSPTQKLIITRNIDFKRRDFTPTNHLITDITCFDQQKVLNSTINKNLNLSTHLHSNTIEKNNYNSINLTSSSNRKKNEIIKINDSISQEKNLFPNVLHTEETKNSKILKTLEDKNSQTIRTKTLNNYLETDIDKPKIIHKRNFTNDYSNIKLIKPNNTSIKRTVLHDQLSKQNVFNVENVKLINQKIIKFCKKYNFQVNQVSDSKYSCQKINQGFGIEINQNQIKVSHLFGNEKTTNLIIKDFISNLSIQ